jgi:hypothetical protein
MAHLYCPNCHHTGRPKKELQRGSVIRTALLLLGSLLIPWLLLLAIPAMLWCVLEKRATSCGECGWRHLARNAPRAIPNA